jgi:hypothetical protein
MQNIHTPEQAIEAFFQAFNTHDGEAYIQSLHFPHIRINAKGQVNILKDASEQPPLENALAYLAKHEGWHHSTLDQVERVQESETKVHFKIQFSRFKADGTCYAVHKSLWVVTRKDNQWGVLARSSFAP